MNRQFEISENKEKEIIRRLNRHKKVNLQHDIQEAWNFYNRPGIKKEWIYYKIAQEAGIKKYKVEYILKKNKEG